MNLPLVSIIIPAYNEELNIGRCLKSLEGLDYPKDRLEIIVVDDGSKDRTTSIVRQFKNVKLITLEKNSGAAKARNRGIDNAKGDILLFIDADCVANKSFVKEHAKHYPEYDCVSGGYVPQIGRTIATKYEYYLAKVMWKDASAGPCFNNGSYKKEVFIGNRFDENIRYCHYEDKDLSQRILAKNYRFYYEPNAKVEHMSEERLSSVLKKKFKSAANHVFYLRRHFSMRSTVPIFFMPLFIFLILFLGIYGLMISFIILLLTPPNVAAVFKMGRYAGFRFFIPFLLLSLLFKVLIYSGIDYGIAKLIFSSHSDKG